MGASAIMKQLNATALIMIACMIYLLQIGTAIATTNLPDLSQLKIDGAEIERQLTHLATFSDDPNPAVTRILFTGRLNCTTPFTVPPIPIVLQFTPPPNRQ